MLWSYVDWQMAVLLAAVMKANSQASVAIFLTLRNARARRDALTAAAETMLKGPDREVFDAIILIYGSLSSQRADLAHGIFGHLSKGKENEMPWIEAKHLSQVWIEKFHLPKGEKEQRPAIDEKLEQKQRTFVYKLADLVRLETEIEQLWLIAFTFASYLTFPNLETAASALRTQCNVPQMAQALSRIRSLQNNPTPQPPPTDGSG
jgi:hypothetical protein